MKPNNVWPDRRPDTSKRGNGTLVVSLDHGFPGDRGLVLRLAIAAEQLPDTEREISVVAQDCDAGEAAGFSTLRDRTIQSV